MSRSTSYLRFAVLLPLLKLLFASLVNALPPQIRDATRIKSRGFEGMHGVDRMVLVEDDDPEGWFYLIMAMMLVLLGGIFAGLTIAYVSSSIGAEAFVLHLANTPFLPKISGFILTRMCF
jgi:hypothetical protein